jgi:transcriptional antiterminator RfaH
MQAWYVVKTKPRNEARAAENLSRQGFPIYCPKYRCRRRRANRVQQSRVPLFPSYLFVTFDISRDSWAVIRSTYGVSQLICRNGDPVAVPEAVLDDIRRREDSDGLVRLDATRNCRPGDPVRIMAGAFADQVGLFDCRTDSERVVVLLRLLGRDVRTVVRSDEVAVTH